jgi:hypothetical protein
VRREDGNWCEGLTTYCADYFAKERESEDAAREYRRSNLTAYRDFAQSGGQDFALTRFRERDSAATQAVGYGKTMMVFHMLRRRVGDDAFWTGLRDLWETKQFTRAGWSDVRASFERGSGSSLEAWFAQWIDRPGAPELSVSGVEREIGKKGARVRGVIRQSEPHFAMRVPVRVSLGDEHEVATVDVSGAETPFTIETAFVPTRLDVDRDFELFRRLHTEEVAAALSGALGGVATRIVLGEREDSAIRDALAAVANEWATDSTIAIADDGAADFDGATWFFGHGAAADAFAKRDLPDEQPTSGNALVAAGRLGGRADRPAAIFFPRDATAVADVARKVPHYSKYSWLTFEGSRNVEKGFWAPGASPLTVEFGS